LRPPGGSACCGPVPDPASSFVRIDCDDPVRGRHYVVHLQDPRLTLELEADPSSPAGQGQGVIRRLCVPNSWAGDYGRYAKLLAQAQDFFSRTGGTASNRLG